MSPKIREEGITTETIEKWDDLQKWENELTHGEWLFRGMQCSEWNLETSLERACKTHYKKAPCSRAPRIENILIREFRRRYHNHRGGIPDPEGIEWLSIMQHYGAPTRLLDFTYSFFIAAYFAVEKPCQESSSHARKKSCSHAIWAVRNKWVAERGIDLLKKGCVDVSYLENEQNEWQWELQESFFKSLLHLGVHDLEERFKRSTSNPSCVFPLNAMRLNERSAIQRGVFLCAGNVTKSFVKNLETNLGENLETNLGENLEENLAEITVEDLEKNPEENLVKLEISHDLRLKALERLHAMNINRASLFPGLEGFAQSLATYHPLA